MFCPTCGSQLPNNAVFCGTCGTQVNASPVTAQAQTQAYHAPAMQAVTTPLGRIASTVKAKRGAKRLSRLGAAALSVALIAALAFFCMTSCSDARSKGYDSAREVATALTDATNEFIQGEKEEKDLLSAVQTAASMMPAGIAENYIESLDYKSADAAIRVISSNDTFGEILKRLECMEVTFKASSNNSASRDTVRYYQGELEDLGLDGDVEEVIPLTAKIKATKSLKDANLTRGDSTSFNYTPFYAMKIDGEWYLWISNIEDGIEALDGLDL